ncbi:YihY/virulence factor BrkB family protein [Haloarchaeobius sp. HME9146]|uniref:YihY/virulence factor BrkB family protein n=1 Tax=Haloarchaeobius sp. HME9146 TaxID=2978732 RepID=UPI0021C025D3|nr:YihY/virulence factor BrkB family protein [Haloarchaeobius sp. HME9146]MCT9095903.1 YihY/virulence factor BrkB family protein [Haloarchaeobius sp. HME9146]
MNTPRVLTVLRAVQREVKAENLTFMAGSIAYHAFISLLPFLLVLLAAITAIGGEGMALEVVFSVGSYLSPNAGELLTDTVQRATASASVSILGVVALVWGTLKIFRSLDTAFSDIYESEAENTFADQLSDGILVLLSVGVAAAVAAGVGTLVSLDGSFAGEAFGFLLLVAGLSLVFFPMYYVFPDEDVTVREVIPGTVFAAAGWTTLESLFQYYVAVAGKADAYGVVGAILLLVTWLYFSGLIILVGAALNAVLAGRSEDVQNLGWHAESIDTPEFDDLDRDLAALQAALDDGGEVTITVGGTSVTVPEPDIAEAQSEHISRPRLLGGSERTGRVILRWRREE